MKKLFTAFALFLLTISFAQSTAYHSGDKLGKKTIAGKWFVSGVNQDMLIMVPINTVSYAKVYRELKKALDFYGLQFNEPSKDESVISSLCKSVEDFEMMDLTIKTNSSEISMSWDSDLVLIAWNCTTEAYTLQILEK
jgi:hypothetical protein